VDMSRFNAAPLIAFTAPKETYYGTEADAMNAYKCVVLRTIVKLEERTEMKSSIREFFSFDKTSSENCETTQ